MTMHEVTVTTSEIRAAWATIQAGNTPWSDKQGGSGTARRLGDYRSSTVSSFIGCSGPQMARWLDEGYFVDGEERSMPGGTAEIVAPMVELVEEDGDLILSQALGGEDLVYAQWQDFEAQRGLTIKANIGFSASVNATAIADYYAWILSIVDAAERRGVAPDVILTVGAIKCFARGDDSMTVSIPLVKGGEIVDSVAWRAFLTPGAFRSLGFVALALAADKLKRSLSVGMGRPSNNGFAVSMTDDVLTITGHGQMDHFPKEHMDALLETAGA